MGLKVLSLFDGMSCGQIALNRLGIKVDKYYASEIDKYAIEVTQKNFPDTIQVGDVCELKAEDYQDIDLIMAGSPCQGFSFAGKQLAFEDPRSALFFEFVRLLKAIKPKYFLLENVRMKKEYLTVITEQVSACYPDYQGNDLFGGRIEPIFINSALVSAQSRQRYYWTNISGVEQPKDKGIVLRDILEDEYVSEKEKSYCIDANYYKGASVEQYKNKSRRQLVSKPKQVGGAFRGRAYDKDGKRMDKDGVSVANQTKQMLELRKDDKSNAITTVFKDSVVVDEQLTWRKLTPLECERLQTVPDNYTAGVSNTQRYKMLGNGWTVDVIAHILANMEL